MHYDPSRRGYYGAMARYPGLWGIALDFERWDWGIAKSVSAAGIGPKIYPWSENPIDAVIRYGAYLSLFRQSSVAPFVAAFTALSDTWNIGAFSKGLVDAAAGGGSLFSLQTQKACQRGEASFGALLEQIKQEHAEAGLPISAFPGPANNRKVGLQISFTRNPVPFSESSMPMKTVSPQQALRCTRWADLGSQQTILYWAEPEDVAALLRLKGAWDAIRG